MNKRGQFYLMAAIAVILIIIGLGVIPNSLQKVGTDNSKIYELFVEVNIDNQKLLGYGTMEQIRYNDNPQNNELKNILDKMVGTYPSIETIYILIKRGTTLTRYKYDGKISEEEISSLNNVKIEDITYNFPSDSDNFYYLIIREKNKHQYVIKG